MDPFAKFLRNAYFDQWVRWLEFPFTLLEAEVDNLLFALGVFGLKGDRRVDHGRTFVLVSGSFVADWDACLVGLIPGRDHGSAVGKELLYLEFIERSRRALKHCFEDTRN